MAKCKILGKIVMLRFADRLLRTVVNIVAASVLR